MSSSAYSFFGSIYINIINDDYLYIIMVIVDTKAIQILFYGV